MFWGYFKWPSLTGISGVSFIRASTFIYNQIRLAVLSPYHCHALGKRACDCGERSDLDAWCQLLVMKQLDLHLPESTPGIVTTPLDSVSRNRNGTFLVAQVSRLHCSTPASSHWCWVINWGVGGCSNEAGCLGSSVFINKLSHFLKKYIHILCLWAEFI